MTQSYYPQDSQHLIKSEGASLSKLLRCTTTLEHLKSGSQLTPDDIDNCIEFLDELSLSYKVKLHTVGYYTTH